MGKDLTLKTSLFWSSTAAPQAECCSFLLFYISKRFLLKAREFMSSWTSKCWGMHFIRTVCNTSTCSCVIISRLGCHEVFCFLGSQHTHLLSLSSRFNLVVGAAFPLFCWEPTFNFHFNRGTDLSHRSETHQTWLKPLPHIWKLSHRFAVAREPQVPSVWLDISWYLWDSALGECLLCKLRPELE